jgi:serine/threonine protein kinase
MEALQREKGYHMELEQNEKILNHKQTRKYETESISQPKNDIIGTLNSQYYLIKKIGHGASGTVFLSYAINDEKEQKTFYAIKILNTTNLNENIINSCEVNFLENMNHKNILKVYEHGLGKLQLISGSTQKVYYIIMDYLNHGSLLSQIIKNVGFGEDLGRLIFAQLLDGLEAIHNSNIVHLDIKLNNIMASGDDYTLKYVDFGFATEISSRYLTLYLGTLNYAAPELHMRRPYLGVYEDIFSLGVTLFIIVTGYLPFILPLHNDPLYHYISIGDYITFWKIRNIKVSPSFMELFNNLVAFDPIQRPSISEIKKSKWMKEINWELLPLLKQEFMKREEIINNGIKDSKNKMIQLANKINNNNNINVDEILLKIKEEKKIELVNDIKQKLFNMTGTKEKNLNKNASNNIKKNENSDNKIYKIEKNVGFIFIKNNFSSIRALMILLKNFFKKEGYNETKKDLDNLQMEISNGEIDIVLVFERMNKDIKISYYLENGNKKDLIDFKKIMKKIHLK